ncbi:MAG: hypothetical protein J6M34_01725 [Clostridia bacterium]|nr:hypothetical protein [Clostridia bacterium]
MTEYDLYDLAAIYLIIREKPNEQEYSEVLSSVCRVLSDIENYRYVNALRIELAKIQTLKNKELFRFVFTENVYTHFHGVLKDERVFLTLLEATKQLSEAIRTSPEKAVALADALHNLPVNIADNNFQIPDDFWNREVSYYRDQWDKNFLLDQEKLFLRKKSSRKFHW